MEIKCRDKSQITNCKSQTNHKSKLPKFQTYKFRTFVIWLLVIIWNLVLGNWNLTYLFGDEVKEPNVAGSFYPKNSNELSQLVDSFLNTANPEPLEDTIVALISPHAGYFFSGQTAAFGYKLIKEKSYKTVIIIGPSHYYRFRGISIYPKGHFRTPLGDLEVDAEFTQRLLNKESDVYFEPHAFEKEHSVEVQLPFLQRVLTDVKIVPLITGDCDLSDCRKLAYLLKEAIGERKDVLVVASTDMYHGYDFREAEVIDNLTLSYIKNMDAQGLYRGLQDGKLQLCGGFGVVSALILAKDLGHHKIKVLNYTTSAQVTGRKAEGIWTVGYTSCVIDQEKGEGRMLNSNQRKILLGIARQSIETYLKSGKKLEVSETDPSLIKNNGAFVTLHKQGELRGCIGNIIGTQPLYLTVRDMAVEAAVGDPRFSPVQLTELEKIDIEISVLSELKRIEDPLSIQLGVHGVLVKRGFNSGVFLPQVATETGWTKEEFLSYLCSHKAGLSSEAWKDKSTEIYVFTAEVFSEND